MSKHREHIEENKALRAQVDALLAALEEIAEPPEDATEFTATDARRIANRAIAAAHQGEGTP